MAKKLSITIEEDEGCREIKVEGDINLSRAILFLDESGQFAASEDGVNPAMSNEVKALRTVVQRLRLQGILSQLRLRDKSSFAQMLSNYQ